MSLKDALRMCAMPEDPLVDRMLSGVLRLGDKDGNVQRLRHRLDQFPVRTYASEHERLILVTHIGRGIGRRLANELWQAQGMAFDLWEACMQGMLMINAALSLSAERALFQGKIVEKRNIMLSVFSGIVAELMQRRAVRIYSVQRDLCVALRGTRLRGIAQGDVTLPEPYVFVHLDDGQDSFCTIAQMTGADDERFLGFCIGSANNKMRLSDRGGAFIISAAISLEEIYDMEHPSIGTLVSTNDILATVNNALLYITNNEHDVVRGSLHPELEDMQARMLRAKGARREKLKARLRKISDHPVFLVGGTYVIDKRLTEGTGLATGRHLNVRFIVAGHWRQQPCGEGSRQRKLIWIAPHWKGPELAPVTRSVGIVRQPVRQGGL